MAKNDKAPKAKAVEPITLSYAPNTNPKKRRTTRAIIAAAAIAAGTATGYVGTDKAIMPKVGRIADKMSDQRYDRKMQEVVEHQKNMAKWNSEYFKRLDKIAGKLRVYRPSGLKSETLFPFEQDDKDGKLRKAIESDPELNRLRLKILEGDKKVYSSNYYPTYGSKPPNYNYPRYWVSKNKNTIRAVGTASGAAIPPAVWAAGRWLQKRRQRRPTRK